MGSTRLATSADSASVVSLRQQAYKASRDFSVENAENMSWDEGDDCGFVLGVWDDSHELISTMRANLIFEPSEFRDQVASTVPEDLSYPALLLRKAATAHEARGQNLNALLRFFFFEAAMKAQIRFILGNVTTHGIRVQTMLELGYKLSDMGMNNLAGLEQSAGPWRLAMIDLNACGATATELLKNKCGDLLREYPWSGPGLQFSLANRSL